MKAILRKLRFLPVCLLMFGFLLSVMPSSVVSAQAGFDSGSVGPVEEDTENPPCSQSFLTFPAWYRGLLTADCEIMSPSDHNGKLSGFIWTIALNIVEMLLHAAGYAAVAFIIYGGYKYMISAGSPDGMVSARKTIMNAVIGLVISVGAIAIVRTIAGGMGVGM